jgi:hypothetical protein
MKASRSAATRSGRSQLGLWPVAGYTITLAPRIATARSSSSSRGRNRSHSPHSSKVGAAIRPRSAASSNANRPSSALFQTRAGSLRLSATSRSKNRSGRAAHYLRTAVTTMAQPGDVRAG